MVHSFNKTATICSCPFVKEVYFPRRCSHSPHVNEGEQHRLRFVGVGGLVRNFSALFLFAMLLFGPASFAGGNIPFLLIPNSLDYQLKITTTAQTIAVGNCSGNLGVQAQDRNGNSVTVSSAMTVSFATVTNVTYYSDQECLTATTSVTIPAGTTSTKVYFTVSAAGSYIVTASAAGYLDAVQTETVTANNYVWTGGGADAKWSTAANWSGGVAPGSTTPVIFDSTCVSNCSPNLSANTSVGPVRINSGYSGTITQGAYTLTVNGTWVQAAGTFVGSNTGIALTITNGFSITGGSFTSTSGTLSVTAAANQISFRSDDPSYFHHNSGTIYVGSGVRIPLTFTAPLGVTYNNFTFHLNQSSVTFNNSIDIAGDLTVDDTFQSDYQGGTINITGNLTLSGTTVTGTTWFKMVGVNPTINGTVATGSVASLEIAVSGTVAFQGTIGVDNNYKYTSGTINAGTSTLAIRNPNNLQSDTVTPGTQVYNNVTFSPNNNTVTIVGTFSVGGTLAIQYSCCGSLNGGTLDARGNVTISSGNISGTTTLQMTGTTNTTLSMATSGPSGVVTINKTSGAKVTLISNVSFNAASQTINLVAGSLDMAGYNLTLKTTPTLNGNTITKNGGVLTVNGSTVGTGSLYGGTVSP